MRDLVLDKHLTELIDVTDILHYRRFERMNRTRFYNVLVESGTDIEIHTVACRWVALGGRIAIKEVFKSSVDGDKIHVKDLVHAGMQGYQVDWSSETNGKRYFYQDRGKWANEPYQPASSLWKIDCPVVNPQVLQASPRFKYCAWEGSGMRILDYLKTYVLHPRVEFLTKAGVSRFSTKPAFVKKLENEKNFMSFFSSNLAEIKKKHYGADVIRMGFSRKISLSDAEHRISASRKFRGYSKPNEVDAIAATAYMQKHGLHSEYDYCKYLNNCKRLGLDLHDTKNAFPKKHKQRFNAIKDDIRALETRENAEKAKKMAEDLLAVSAKFAKLEKLRGSFCVVIPKTESEFAYEEKHLHNCLFKSHYAHKMSRGDSIVMFVRLSGSPTVPFVAVEYSPETKSIMQCYADKNSKPPENVLEFVNSRLLKAANKVLAV